MARGPGRSPPGTHGPGQPAIHPLGEADLEALVLAPVPPHSLLVPKVSSTEDVIALVQRLEDLEAQRSSPYAPVNLMLVATETAAGA